MTYDGFINCASKYTFNYYLNDNKISDKAIVFIEDTNEIWTHNKFYPCPYTKSLIDTMISNITYDVVSATENGLMSSIDKSIFDSFINVMSNGELNAFIITESTFDNMLYYWDNEDEVLSCDTINAGAYYYDSESNSFIFGENSIVSLPSIPVATTTSGGIITPEDKSKIDNIKEDLIYQSNNQNTTIDIKGDCIIKAEADPLFKSCLVTLDSTKRNANYIELSGGSQGIEFEFGSDSEGWPTVTIIGAGNIRVHFI